MIENTEDLILLLGAVTALFSGLCAAVRLSRCDLIKSHLYSLTAAQNPLNSAVTAPNKSIKSSVFSIIYIILR